MILIPYLLTLGVSADLVGVFVHRTLAPQGYVVSLKSGLFLTAGVACLYGALEIFYVALVRLLKPTRSAAHLVSEGLSHLSALILLPYLLGVKIEWPDPALYAIEPLLYLGAFAVIHLFVKLLSLFAALRSRPARRRGALGWLSGSVMCGLAGLAFLGGWVNELDEARPLAPETVKHYRIGDQYAAARILPEGCVMRFSLDPFPNQCLTMRWANLPDPLTDSALQQIHVSVSLRGKEHLQASTVLALHASEWAEWRLPVDQLPSEWRMGEISWTAEREPRWRRFVGLRPVVKSERRVLLSGPFPHEMRASQDEPNFVIIMIEGLGSRRVSRMGYFRNTTPSLDRAAATSLSFPNVFTPAPEIAAACMTLLTGLSPLKHGYLGERRGPLPAPYKTLPEVLKQEHYATAAFTEADAAEDLVFGTGFERGFDLYATSYISKSPPHERSSSAADPDAGPQQKPEGQVQPRGSALTLERAQAWVDRNAEVKFMVFVRLRELMDLELKDWYTGGFVQQAGRPTRSDIYDTALVNLDHRLGAFIKHVRDYETRKNTCIVIASPYGLDFSLRAGALVALTEECLRVPLLFQGPNIQRSIARELVGLEDIAPSLLQLVLSRFDTPVEGRSLLAGPIRKEPISMHGSPLALSLRTNAWRFVWKSGYEPFTPAAPLLDGPTALYDMAYFNRTGIIRDVSASYPTLVADYRNRLYTYLADHHTQPAEEDLTGK